MSDFDTVTSLAIILLAAIVHASFQLSISVLTLLSGHALGRSTAHHRLVRLSGGFIFGVGIMTILLLSTLSLFLSLLFPTKTPLVLWAATCGAVVGVGISVWLFYFRKQQGTSLWIPRGVARYLNDRSKATKSAGETFGLGLTSAFAEILFTFAPLLVTALLLIRLPADLQLLGLLGYSGVSLLPLLVVGLLIGNRRKLSHIQRWRENNKNFLQFVAGTGLLVLAVYVYVEKVVTVAVATMGRL